MDQETEIRINDEFLRLTDGLNPTVGCWNVTVVNKKTGEGYETQGDIHKGYTWRDFLDWLKGDMQEMDIGPLKDLSITDLEYAGIDDPAEFE